MAARSEHNHNRQAVACIGWAAICADCVVDRVPSYHPHVAHMCCAHVCAQHLIDSDLGAASHRTEKLCHASSHSEPCRTVVDSADYAHALNSDDGYLFFSIEATAEVAWLCSAVAMHI